MARISASVGRGGINRPPDVVTVQTLINRNIQSIAPLRSVTANGVVGGDLISCIEAFQRRVVRLRRPDGRVDPNGRTLAALNRRAGEPASSAERVYRFITGPQEPLADIARPYIGATEAQGNRMGDDPRMREIFEADWLARDGRTDGYPWCCAFVSLCVQRLIAQSMYFGHVTPPRTASVSNFRTRWAPAQQCLVFPPTDGRYRPHKGDVVVFTFSHIGIVDTVGHDQVRTIEGNTNAAGSREGTTVRQKDRAFRSIRCFIRLPVPASYDFINQVCIAPGS